MYSGDKDVARWVWWLPKGKVLKKYTPNRRDSFHSKHVHQRRRQEIPSVPYSTRLSCCSLLSCRHPLVVLTLTLRPCSNQNPRTFPRPFVPPPKAWFRMVRAMHRANPILEERREAAGTISRACRRWMLVRNRQRAATALQAAWRGKEGRAVASSRR